jgi:prepilin-type N-terminal cleavage/methylation domain-containing protein
MHKLRINPMVKNKGFTFIEVVAVIVVLGVVSAFVIAKTFNFQTNADENASLAKFKNHLGYARTKALNSEAKWGIGIVSSGYFLFKENISDKKLFPGEENLVVDYSSSGNILISGSTILFDNFGHPSDINGNIKQFVFSAGDNSVIVYKSGYIK